MLGGACVSNSSFDTDLKGSQLVMEEARHNCSPNVYSSFICICALSTVVRRKITTFYPDQGEKKYKTLFNDTTIHPRIEDSKLKPFKILFCRMSENLFDKVFIPDHFVPLVDRKEQKRKRKAKVDSRSESKDPPKKSRKTDLKIPTDAPSKQLKLTSSTNVCSNESSVKKVLSTKKPSATTSKNKGDIMLSNPTLFNYFSFRNSQLGVNPSANSGTSSPRPPSNVPKPACVSLSPPAAPKPTCGAARDVSVSTSTSSGSPPAAPKPICGATQDADDSASISLSPLPVATKPTSTSFSPLRTPGHIIPDSPNSPTFQSDNSQSSAQVPAFFQKRVKHDIPTLRNEDVHIPPSNQNINEESKFDVGTYFSQASKSLPETEIFDLINNVFSPDSDFKFPKHAGGRKFRHAWLSEYDWLKYSPSREGGFCLPCSLFSHGVPSKSKGLMTSKPIFPSANTHNALRDHANTLQGIHAFSVGAMNKFKLEYEGRAKSIDALIETAIAQKEEQLREVLRPIVDTVIFLGRRGLPFRGHRDSSSAYPEAGCYSTDPGLGNFIELLNYGIRRGDNVLKDHYENHPKNASYMSHQIQNEIIDCCGEYILDTILARVKEAKYFSVLADEAMDASKKEQLSIVLRYIHDNKIYEDFSGFVHLNEGLTGEHLADAILKFLDTLGLNYKDIRGQGYDGAGAVAGYKSGCSARILAKNDKALYCHCFCHRLNLAICRACEIRTVNNMLKIVKECSIFFAFSEGRQRCFESHIDKMFTGETHSRLKDVCRTRWLERILGLDSFEELLPALLEAFEEMHINEKKEYNKETCTRAHYLHKAIDFEFIANLVITRLIFDMSLEVTELLQSRGNDIADGVNQIRTLIDKVKHHRDKRYVGDFHDECYSKVLSLANKLGIDEYVPRVCKRQRNRDNPPHVSASDYYKKVVTIPVLDHLHSELTTRFSEDSYIAYKGLYLIPSKIISLKSKGETWKDKFYPFLKFYEDDLPSPLTVDSELALWEDFWVMNTKTCPNNVQSTLLSCLQNPPTNSHSTLSAVSFPGFQNIKCCLKILASLPITTCECERSFSGMRRLKTYTRATMNQERFSNLALMQFHPSIIPDKESVINRFLGKKRRRYGK